MDILKLDILIYFDTLNIGVIIRAGETSMFAGVFQIKLQCLSMYHRCFSISNIDILY